MHAKAFEPQQADADPDRGRKDGGEADVGHPVGEEGESEADEMGGEPGQLPPRADPWRRRAGAAHRQPPCVAVQDHRQQVGDNQ